MSHARTLETIIAQVRIPFRPKHDPRRNLAEEIESCKRKIWECIDPAERKQYFEKKQKKNEKQDGEIESKQENSKNSSNSKTQKIEDSSVVGEMGQKKKSQPLLTRTDIELKVFVLKVVELKKELKSRGQDASGLKKDLRNRLINTMLEETQKTEIQYKSGQNKLHLSSDSIIIEESPEEQKESPEFKDVLQDSPKKEDIREICIQSLQINNNEISAENLRKESVSSLKVEHHSENAEHANEKKMDNFRDPVETENKEQEQKITMSMSKPSLKSLDRLLAPIRETHTDSSKISDALSKTHSQNDKGESELTEVKVKTFSESKEENDMREDVPRPSSEVSCSTKSSGNSVKDMVSKFSGFSSSLSSSNSGSALSKGLQAKKEARQAKIAEMRAKAQNKPATASKVALKSKEFSSTLTCLNATASTASAQKKNLTTQMREKAAARAFQNKVTNSVSKLGSKPMMSSSCKRHLPLTNNSNHSNNNVLDSLGTTLKQPSLTKKSSKILSPMDTYDISDREDSETDDSDSESENDKPKKNIPTWAQKPNLYPALEEQYNGRIGSSKVDPDDIFPEVQSCDLEAIFGPKKSKLYKRRASSGNWANDQVTVAEKLVYKREMGFASDADDFAKV